MSNRRESKTVNDIREVALVNHFKKNIERRVFILTESFPFMFIGKIKDVLGDIVVLDVQTTSIPALEGKEWNVHIDAIDVFYIETKTGPKIPHLKDSSEEKVI